MKGLKKLLTGILAGAMAITMALSAGNATEVRAAGDGSITVSNTTQGETYKLYKVFDATYSGTNVAYTYTSKGEGDDFLAALQNETESPFTVVSNGTSYNVVKKESASDKNVIDFIKKYGPTRNEDKTWTAGYYGDAVATDKGNGGSITFRNLDYGYYYITSSLGAIVTIDSALKDVTVIDKNQETTIDKEESVDGGTNWEYTGQGTTEDPIPTQAVGSVVNYKVSGTITQYVGTKKVTYLLFTDTMSKGLTATKDVNVKVKKNGEFIDVTSSAEIGYDVQEDKTVTTITVPTVDAGGNFLYASNADYVITYTATINEKALDEVQNNKVTLTDNNGSDLGYDETKVVNYHIALTKTDKKGVELAGAKFLLYTSKDIKDKSTLVPVVLVSGTGDATSKADNVYRVAKSGETGVEMVTGKTGVIIVKGLKNGDYYFEETEAPAGFNMLTERKHVEAEGYSEQNLIPSINNAHAAITVINETGSVLPSTGGIGTTIFYILGGILIVAGVAYFIVRRKASAE